MAILERHAEVIGAGEMAKHLDLVKRFAAVEARLGYPPARRFSVSTGPSLVGTRVLEREWSSLAAMEACISMAQTDPEWQALVTEASSLNIRTHTEILQVV